MSSDLHKWAIPKVQSLLPVDEETASQVVDQAISQGSSEAIADYLKGFLGESSDALTFISDFTSRIPRKSGPPSISVGSPTPTKPSSSKPAWSISDAVPATKRKPQRGRGSYLGFKQPPRQANEGMGGSSSSGPGKVYMKKDEDDYIVGPKRSGNNTPQPPVSVPPPIVPNQPLEKRSDAVQAVSGNVSGSGSKKQQGTLTSDLLVPKSKPTRSKSPAASSSSNSNKISIITNSTMRPNSTVLSDLESAIRALELSTNPSLLQGSSAASKRTKCSCQATIHDLLLAAPNCLSCGKIICIKEGLGPCTFCNSNLLTSSQTQEMIQFLREERGREKMNLDNKANKKAEVSRTPRPFSNAQNPGINTDPLPGANPTPPTTGPSYGTPEVRPPHESPAAYDAAALARAKAHRDKLLTYQAQNAQRTHIIDEAADFDTSAIESSGYGGLNMWASPAERALQLKKQQKRMKEVEWAGKEDWEKRRVVVSIDLSGKGGKGGAVVRREMKKVDMEHDDEDDENDTIDIRSYKHQPDQPATSSTPGETSASKAGRYAHNPLLKSLIRPVFKPSSQNIQNKPKPQNKKQAKAKLNANDITNPLSYNDEYDDDFPYEEVEEENSILPDVVKARVEGGRMGGWRRVLQDDIEIENNERWILDGGSADGGLCSGENNGELEGPCEGNNRELDEGGW